MSPKSTSGPLSGRPRIQDLQGNKREPTKARGLFGDRPGTRPEPTPRESHHEFDYHMHRVPAGGHSSIARRLRRRRQRVKHKSSYFHSTTGFTNRGRRSRRRRVAVTRCRCARRRLAAAVRERRPVGRRQRGQRVRDFLDFRRQLGANGIARRRKLYYAQHGQPHPRKVWNAHILYQRAQRPHLGLAEVTGNGVSIARIIVSWDNNDVSDYLSGGYWAHLPGDTQALRFTGAEVGAFVDGPELSLSNPPTMPLQGSASYSGVAAGIYGIEYGTDAAAFTGYARNSIEVGEFDSVIDLTADFGRWHRQRMRRLYRWGILNRLRLRCSDWRSSLLRRRSLAHLGLALETTPFASDGTFRGQNVILESSLYTVSNSGGAWGGQFSNIPDSAGVPRLAAGTFAGQGTTAGGSEAVFVGAFGAGQQ